MSLNGELSTMPLPDLLQWLASAAKTGVLEVERNKLTRWIQFEEGIVVGCSSDDPPQRLGQFLLSRELITPDQLRQALAEQEETGKHLGLILVESGMLSADDLAEHLEAKAEETIYSIFDWDDGVFRFSTGAQPNKDVFSVKLAVPDIILRGMQRFDDMKRIREVFDDGSLILRYTATPPGPDIFQNKMARTMYAAIDGDRSIAEILLHVHGSEYIVHKFLFELHRKGYVEIAGRKEIEPPPISEAVERREAAQPPQVSKAALPEFDLEPITPAIQTQVSADTAGSGAAAAVQDPPPTAPSTASPAVDPQLARARELMNAGEIEPALTLLDGLYRRHPENDALRRLTAEAEAAFVHKAYRHVVPADKIPVLTRPVESLGAEALSPEEFFMLSRIDGTWNIKSIIQVSPMREVDALKSLARMRTLGMIELREAD